MRAAGGLRGIKKNRPEHQFSLSPIPTPHQGFARSTIQVRYKTQGGMVKGAEVSWDSGSSAGGFQFRGWYNGGALEAGTRPGDNAENAERKTRGGEREGGPREALGGGGPRAYRKAA